jgi:hypothetical protein
VNDDSDPGGEDPKARVVDRSMPKDGVARRIWRLIWDLLANP